MMVSVIVPVYNVEKYVGKCIESIIAQSYKELEILLIDDGSTDNSGIICEEYAKQDNRIKVYHKKNGGLSDARNYGIKRAIGREITLVDSDDEIAPDMIEVLHDIKKRYNAQISVCYRLRINENGNPLDSEPPIRDIHVGTTTEESLKAYFTCPGAGLVAWGKLYDSILFSNVEYPVGRYNEDVFTTYKLLAKCTHIVITTEKLYYYRIRQGSIMNRAFEKKHLDMIFGGIQMTEFFEHHYPQVAIYSQRLLIYSVLRAFIWMIKSNYHQKKEAFILMRGVLRKYRHIIGTSWVSLKAKLLSYLIIYWPINN